MTPLADFLVENWHLVLTFWLGAFAIFVNAAHKSPLIPDDMEL